MPDENNKPTWDEFPRNNSLKGDGDLVREVDLKGRGYTADGKWAKGTSGNPGGPIKKKLFRRVLIEKLTKDPERLNLIIEKALIMAENGDISYFVQLRDMIDGKPANRTVVEDDEDDLPPNQQLDDIDKRLEELIGQTDVPRQNG